MFKSLKLSYFRKHFNEKCYAKNKLNMNQGYSTIFLQLYNSLQLFPITIFYFQPFTQRFKTKNSTIQISDLIFSKQILSIYLFF